MPRVLDVSHTARRLRVCAVCLKKADREITPNTLTRIHCLAKRRYYQPDDSRVPGGICSSCRLKLAKADRGEKNVSYSTIEVPDMECVQHLESLDACGCRWCCIAQEAPGARQPGEMMLKTKTLKQKCEPMPEPARVTTSTCSKLQVQLNLSNNQTLKLASVLRSELGRSAVQPHLKQELEARDRQLDDCFVSVDLQAESQAGGPAPAVVCSDTSAFLQLVVARRDVDPHGHMVKVGIDGGGGMLKVTANIIGSSSSSSTTGPFLDAGVKRLLLLAVAPGVGETYAVMARLLRELHLEDIGGIYFAADLKMANIICGLQVSFTSLRFYILVPIGTYIPVCH